ncbi:MAG: hypothetical protein WCP85_09555 [Mariniphaga sp.]
MTSNLSSGAGSNVTNLNTLNSAILGYGNRYNPINALITPAALHAVYLSGLSAVNAVDSTLPVNMNAKNSRSIAFDGLDKLTTRIANSFKSIVANESAREHVRSLINLIQKGRVKPKKTKATEAVTKVDPTTVKEITSHKSGYDKQLDNLYKLIQFLASFPSYKPNEADLTIAGLSALYSDLTAKNQAVTDSQIQLDNARMNRETILYQSGTGLVQLCDDSKSYIKSVFGANSPEYNQVSKLKFRIYKH